MAAPEEALGVSVQSGSAREVHRVFPKEAGSQAAALEEALGVSVQSGSELVVLKVSLRCELYCRQAGVPLLSTVKEDRLEALVVSPASWS